jgi:hypothetical protein
MNAEMT